MAPSAHASAYAGAHARVAAITDASSDKCIDDRTAGSSDHTFTPPSGCTHAYAYAGSNVRGLRTKVGAHSIQGCIQGDIHVGTHGGIYDRVGLGYLRIHARIHSIHGGTEASTEAINDDSFHARNVLGSMHAHDHGGSYARATVRTDASPDDGTAGSTDASGGHSFDTGIVSASIPACAETDGHG